MDARSPPLHRRRRSRHAAREEPARALDRVRARPAGDGSDRVHRAAQARAAPRQARRRRNRRNGSRRARSGIPREAGGTPFPRQHGASRAGALRDDRQRVRRRRVAGLDGRDRRHGPPSPDRVAARLRKDEGDGARLGAREAVRRAGGAGARPDPPDARGRRLARSTRALPGCEARVQSEATRADDVAHGRASDSALVDRRDEVLHVVAHVREHQQAEDEGRRADHRPSPGRVAVQKDPDDRQGPPEEAERQEHADCEALPEQLQSEAVGKHEIRSRDVALDPVRLRVHVEGRPFPTVLPSRCRTTRHANNGTPLVIQIRTLTDGGQSPAEIARLLASFLEPAEQTLDIAIYDVNLADETEQIVLGTLRAAAARGVRVRLLYNVDNRPPGDVVPPPPKTRPDEIEALPVATCGIPGWPDLMHHKYVVRDRASVWTGSTNWTDDSWSREENVVAVVDSDAIADRYAEDFDQLWLTKQ